MSCVLIFVESREYSRYLNIRETGFLVIYIYNGILGYMTLTHRSTDSHPPLRKSLPPVMKLTQVL